MVVIDKCKAIVMTATKMHVTLTWAATGSPLYMCAASADCTITASQAGNCPFSVLI